MKIIKNMEEGYSFKLFGMIVILIIQFYKEIFKMERRMVSCLNLVLVVKIYFKDMNIKMMNS